MYRISNNLLVLVLSFSFLIGCETMDTRLTIKNSCDVTLFFVVTNEELDILFNDAEYPLNKNAEFTFYPRREPHSEYVHPIGGSRYWDSMFSTSSTKQLRIYVYDEKTLQDYEWGHVIKNKMYRKCINVTAKELDQLNWTINICP